MKKVGSQREFVPTRLGGGSPGSWAEWPLETLDGWGGLDVDAAATDGGNVPLSCVSFWRTNSNRWKWKQIKYQGVTNHFGDSLISPRIGWNNLIVSNFFPPQIDPNISKVEKFLVLVFWVIWSLWVFGRFRVFECLRVFWCSMWPCVV